MGAQTYGVHYMDSTCVYNVFSNVVFGAHISRARYNDLHATLTYLKQRKAKFILASFDESSL